MKKKIFKSSLIFALFLMFGFQQSANAQLTVINNTDCWVYFGAGESNNCNPCNQQEDWLAPNGGFTTLTNTCGANWIYVRYGTAPFPNPSSVTGGGITYAPAAPIFTPFPQASGCGQDIQGNCFGTGIIPVWNGTNTVVSLN